MITQMLISQPREFSSFISKYPARGTGNSIPPNSIFITFCLNAFLAKIFKSSKKQLLLCQIQPVSLCDNAGLVFTINGAQQSEWPKLASWVESAYPMEFYAEIDAKFCPWFFNGSYLSIIFQAYVFAEIEIARVDSFLNSYVKIRVGKNQYEIQEKYELFANTAIEMKRGDYSVFYAIPWLADRDSSRSAKDVVKYCQKIYKWYKNKSFSRRKLPLAKTESSLYRYQAQLRLTDSGDFFPYKSDLWFFGAKGLTEPYLSQWFRD